MNALQGRPVERHLLQGGDFVTADFAALKICRMSEQ